MSIAVELDSPHYVKDYNKLVKSLLKDKPLDEAMSMAVGGAYNEMGPAIVNVLKVCGLRDGMSVIDLGCGSGRVAKPLGAEMPNLEYLGLDIVPELLEYARSQSPKTFRFQINTELSLPVASNSIDMIFAFSVFTHLLHEESFLYLEDAMRVLKPGGKIVFSFLESPKNWEVFENTVKGKREGNMVHLNVFIERPMIQMWADHLGMEIVSEADIGQSVVALKKR